MAKDLRSNQISRSISHKMNLRFMTKTQAEEAQRWRANSYLLS